MLMRKLAKYLFTLGIAALSFAACEEKPEPVVEPVKYVLAGDTVFNSSLEATVKVTADKAAEKDVTVDIALDASSTFPQGVLDFPASVNVAKGATEVSATVKILSTESLTPGQEYKAVFGASVEGVALAEKVTITYTRPDLNGKWSVIGTIGGSNWDKDFEMTEGEGGWYAVEGIEATAGNEFKFRRDGAWTVNFGNDAGKVGEEFAVTQDGKNIKIEEEGVYTMSLNPNKAVAKFVKTGDLVKVITLADLVALMPADNKATADFKGILNDVLVTYVSGSNVFLEDATAAMLLYKKDSGLKAGVTLSGYFEGKVQNFNNLPEISELTYKQEELTIGQAEVPAPQEMTIADVLTNFDKLISKRVKLVNAYAGADIQKKGSYDIFQGESSIKFYTNVDLKKGFKAGSIFDVEAIVTPYNTDKQLKIFEEAAITRLIPVMTMSDIQALCTSSTNADFVGVFDGLYVNYILGTQHIYLEDASGALRFWSSNGKTLKFSGEQHTLAVGDKISGVISGTCKLDSGRPTINWLDFSYASVVAAPADEQPKPVTGTLGSFTDVNGLMYRRVVLENVVLEADVVNSKSSQIVTVSDGTGTMPLHIRFKPSQAIPKGYKVSGIGTFDVNGGKLEIRVFSQSDVTGVTPPSE